MIVLELIFLILLISASAFFSSAEMALFSLPRPKVSAMKDSSSQICRTIFFLLNNYGRTLVTIILANMFVNSLISMLGDTLLEQSGLTGSAKVCVSALTSIVVLLLFGEITPMSLANSHCETWSKVCAPVVFMMRKTLFPVVFLTEKVSSFFVSLSGEEDSSPLSREEFSFYIDSALRKGAFSETETLLLHETLELCTKPLEEIMLPRTVAGFVKDSSSAQEVLQAVYASGRYALLVGSGGIDSADRILYAYDFLRMPEEERISWQKSDCLKKALFIPETTPVINALKALRRTRCKAAIVTDEYGGISGTVTLPRIYLSLTGGYVDELPGSIRESRRKSFCCWEYDGRTPADAVMEETNWHPEGGPFEAKTLNGLFCELAGAMPEAGKSIVSGNGVLKILKVEKNIASQLELTVKETEGESEK